MHVLHQCGPTLGMDGIFSPNPEYARRKKIGVRIGGLEEGRGFVALCFIRDMQGGMEDWRRGVDRALG